MFTGIIQTIGRIAGVEARRRDRRLTIQAGKLLRGVKPGDSIAVAGVCLTVIERDDRSFTADVVPETLARTTLGTLTRGSRVNLERAATPTTAPGRGAPAGPGGDGSRVTPLTSGGRGGRVRCFDRGQF